MNKRLVIIIVTCLCIGLVVGVSGAVILQSHFTVEIKEPIVINSPTVSVQTFAGQYLDLNWTLTNLANAPVNVTASITTTFQSTVSSMRGGADPGYYSTSNPIQLYPGPDYIAFFVNVGNSVTPGTYSATIQVVR